MIFETVYEVARKGHLPLYKCQVTYNGKSIGLSRTHIYIKFQDVRNWVL